MLRRYLIVNGTLTVLMYGAVWAFAPSVPHLVQSAQSSFKTFAIDSPLLRPVVDRIIVGR
ncbi:MAG: hypothetical protein J0H37_01890 [Hyphomicrobium denitrificans]|jgi:hypothetical protein|uniref:hypothetical protein n=1 Tax=Hyphomicrobium sp. GJ21 TaxID=113574 RepID=UPI000622BCB2|nr:hypothetical protein [Hyphomicrobium sp. GJ21]MBN9281021.1 hypothetical protein [Hyphomicrobium denitrificans]MBN9353033.1 hypothetical protein [Hyphomicrobium denitrificans]CEJ84518.1 conserved exported hypothetical protein [Hyphomicrobium sp. GJ21]